MAKNKLSLVRETILPLSSDELSQVAGGGITDAIRSNQSGITGTLQSQTCFPQPRPTSGLTSQLTSGISRGVSEGISRQVSGASNAF
jgi:hypothetical protein